MIDEEVTLPPGTITEVSENTLPLGGSALAALKAASPGRAKLLSVLPNL